MSTKQLYGRLAAMAAAGLSVDGLWTSGADSVADLWVTA